MRVTYFKPPICFSTRRKRWSGFRRIRGKLPTTTGKCLRGPETNQEQFVADCSASFCFHQSAQGFHGGDVWESHFCGHLSNDCRMELMALTRTHTHTDTHFVPELQNKGWRRSSFLTRLFSPFSKCPNLLSENSICWIVLVRYWQDCQYDWSLPDHRNQLLHAISIIFYLNHEKRTHWTQVQQDCWTRRWQRGAASMNTHEVAVFGDEMYGLRKQLLKICMRHLEAIICHNRLITWQVLVWICK